MYLKSLELYGFKSFPDRTKLIFEKGTTVIVGPNGSGKSNLSDAMKWVLGELSTKSIRGSKMEDIIFSGTDTRKPMGFAEVSVTFDNTDPENKLECPYDEVTVTRRYYRAGESEYFINRRAVRLRDIYELFMNTGIGRDGYSIIGQGKIAEIISQKSEERRGIFEDASGIAKYRFKKNTAERKLSQTLDNLTRINDIFLEVESRIVPLEKEAERAKKAIGLMERKKEVDIKLWLFDSEKIRIAIENLTDILARADFDVENLSQSLEDMRTQSERLLEKSQSNKTDSEQLLTAIRTQTADNFTLDSEYKLTERNISHTRELCEAAHSSLASYIKMYDSEKAAAEEREVHITENKEKLAAMTTKQDLLKSEREKLEKTIKTMKEASDRALEDVIVLEEQLNGIRTQIAVMQNSSTGGFDKNASVSKEIEKYEAENDELTKQFYDKEKLLKTYSDNIAELETIISQIKEKLAEQMSSHEQNMQALSSMLFKKDSISQRIDTYKALEDQFDGYIQSVKYVMKCYAEGKILDKRGNPCGMVYGPLSKVIEVDERYVIAVETALGANLQNIVVEDENTATSAMLALKYADKGRATFFPLTSMKGQSPSKEVLDASRFDGFVSAADKLIKCDSKFSHIVSSLLSRTVVFDTIDNANIAAKRLNYHIRIVTLDGQQINVGGSFTGGSVNRKGGMLSRVAEIRRLQDEANELEQSVSKAKNDLEISDKTLSELRSDIDDKENSKQLMTVMANTVLPIYEKLKAQIEANNTLIAKMKADFDEICTQRAEYESRIKELSAQQTSLSERITELKAFRNERNIEINSTEDTLAEKSNVITEMFIAVSNLSKDIDTEQALAAAAKTRMAEINDNIIALRTKIDKYSQDIELYEEKLKQNRELAVLGEKNLSDLSARRDAIEQTGSEFETRLSEINRRTSELITQKETAYSLRTVTASKLDNLKAEQDKMTPILYDDYGLTRKDALELGYPMITEKERPALAAIQTECRNKLRVIGHVDLDAVNKYNELKVRYDTMLTQLTDLREAEDKIRNEIKSLEKQMESTFRDAFNRINENFGKVFAELFGGGHAEILLTDPNDVLSSGIEIKAAPPGKIIKSLMQLSGGEQSFIAIALFFATLQVNPTPFCILDEIEAALDEANVARLASYIKRYSNETQFILISHRRGTMEAAERLYGVTMPERGISKILSLIISEIARKGKGDKELDGLFG